MKYAKIEWIDSNEMWGWHECEEYPLSHCETIGTLIHEDNDKISIALTTNNERRSCVITIPKGCIKKITPLEVSNEPSP